MKKLITIATLLLFLLPTQVNARTYIDYGLMKCTAYCPCVSCSDNYGRQTHSGKTAEAGRTIAVDPSVIDIGSKVKIGDHIYVAEDVGNAVIGDTVDIFFDTHEEVDAFGVQYKLCWVVKDE